MSQYAAKTDVPSDRTRTEIERTLRRYNATAFAYGWQNGAATIGFTVANRSVRVEVSALATLLRAKGVFTADEYLVALQREAELLNAAYEHRFPGVTAHENGLTFDKRRLPWMKGWRP